MPSDVLKTVSTRQTPQSETIPGRSDQVMNNAGGAVFKITPEQQVLRFCILGTSGNNYYVSEQKLTRDNADFLIEAFAQDPSLVDVLVSVSRENRAPKQNPTLFALAIAASSTNDATRKKALAVIPEICRIATHLYIFAGYVEQFRGWGRGLREAVANWFTSKSTDDLAYQAIKYRQREGWTMRDLYRLSHPKFSDESSRVLGKFILDKPFASSYAVVDNIWCGEDAFAPSYVRGYLSVNKPGVDIPALVTEYNLPWEALPSEALNDPKVWEALIPHMGLTALIRNLGRFSKLDMLKPFSPTTNLIISKLNGVDLIKSRVHPFNILNALMTYQSGQGFRGSMTWKVNSQIVDALNDAFYASFGNVNPSGKNTLIALDISGSMDDSSIQNSAMNARQASSALAMMLVRTEPNVHVIGFTKSGPGHIPMHNHPNSWMKESGVSEISFITPRSRLDEVAYKTRRLSMGGTDCALPMIYAQMEKLEVDTFCIYTDNETWAGNIHPTQALESYRQFSGRNARLIVNAMTATQYSVADPKDPLQLDVVGFDSSTPDLMSSFSRGDF